MDFPNLPQRMPILPLVCLMMNRFMPQASRQSIAKDQAMKAHHEALRAMSPGVQDFKAADFETLLLLVTAALSAKLLCHPITPALLCVPKLTPFGLLRPLRPSACCWEDRVYRPLELAGQLIWILKLLALTLPCHTLASMKGLEKDGKCPIGVPSFCFACHHYCQIPWSPTWGNSWIRS